MGLKEFKPDCGSLGIQKNLSSDLHFLRLWCVWHMHGPHVTGVWLRWGGGGGRQSMWDFVSNRTAHVSSISEV